MAQRFYINSPTNDRTEITDAVDERTISLTENAEEGSVAISTVLFDDPTLSLDITGMWQFIVAEDEIYEGEGAFFRGYIADRTYMRGRLPLSRQISMQVADVNHIMSRRVMVGGSCKRPAETDVARMQWLVTEAEAGFINDDTYLSTAGPVNMDAVDYRGQMMNQVADDCAQASGKNWGITYDFNQGLPLAGYQIWYGKDSLSSYDSGVLLTNEWTLVNNIDTFEIAKDTKLTRDPSRVFSGVYLPFDRGAVYRRNSTTVAAFGYRDAVMPSLNVKSKTKAIARAARYLADLNEEDDRVETWFEVPAALVNVVRPFHRVRFQASHLPGYEIPRYMRVVKRTVAYATPGRYRISVTLVGPAGSPPLSCSVSVASAVTTPLSNQPYALGIVTLPISPVADASLVIGIAGACNHNTPGSTAMGATGAYTDIYADTVPAGTPTFAMIYRANVPAGATTATAAYTGGFSAAANSKWGGIMTAIATSATTPVQSKGTVSPDGSPAFVTLDSAPTPGNMLIMAIGDRSARPAGPQENLLPATGWTLLETAQTWDDGTSKDCGMWLYARCVQAGDGTGPYGMGAGNQQFCAVAEWEIT